MKPAIFNLEETIGKVVGKRRPPGGILSLEGNRKADMKAWRRAFPTPFIPKGVYRFKTHEEADAWMWKMISRPRES